MTLRFAAGKSAARWASQLRRQGWTEADIIDTMIGGRAMLAVNRVTPANGAIRYIHPTTGKSVVIDEVTREVLHVGASDFKY